MHAPLDGWWWMGWAVPIPTATCPHGVPQTPAWPCCCHGMGSYLAQGRLHPTHAGHPAQCTHSHPRLLPLQILPVGRWGVGTRRLAAAMVQAVCWSSVPIVTPAPASSCSFNPAGRCPGPCLTFQSPSAWTVAWLRCQVSPSIVLMLKSFLNTPLSSTRMLRDPAQGPPARLDACCAVAWCIASIWPPGAYPLGAAPQDSSILC